MESQAPSPISTSIKAVIPGEVIVGGIDETGDHLSLGTVAEVYSALTGPLSFDALDIDIDLRGCSSWPDRWNFDFRSGKRFHALKKLKIRGYDFDDYLERRRRRLDNEHEESVQQLPWWSRWRHYVQMGEVPRRVRESFMGAEEKAEGVEKTNLEKWTEAMDWSHLQFLELIDPSPCFLRTMAHHLESLRELKITMSSGRYFDNEEWQMRSDLTTAFVSSLPNASLTRLTLVNSWDPHNLVRILEVHGPSLKTLDLFSPVLKQPCQSNNLLDDYDVLDIAELCPRIWHLGIDLNEIDLAERKVLEALKSIYSLETLKLKLVSARVNQSNFRGPPDHESGNDVEPDFGINKDGEFLLTRQVALDTFKFLRPVVPGFELFQLELTRERGDQPHARGALYHLPEELILSSHNESKLGWQNEPRISVYCSALHEDGSKKAAGVPWCE